MISPVTVIVLSYNGTADTLTCLDSLRQDRSHSFDILVVDNASTDGAQAAIRARYPDIALLVLPVNRGWAGGNNAGIDQALGQGAELVCLLNNDTVVPAGAVGALADATRRLGPCLMHPAIDFADPAEGAQLDPARSDSSKAYKPIEGTDDIFELNFAYGACLMIPAEVFRRVGMFDERFFLQLEETDFSLRARHVGIRSLCTTRARIVHAESRGFGSRTSPLKTYYIVRNTLLVTEKHHCTLGGVFRALRSLYWTVSRLTQRDDGDSGESFLLWPFSRDPFIVAARAGLRDYLLRRFGQISAASLRAINR